MKITNKHERTSKTVLNITKNLFRNIAYYETTRRYKTIVRTACSEYSTNWIGPEVDQVTNEN